MKKWTIGIDEAGRGPVAGPVSVGVFATAHDFDLTTLEGIRDSKTLSEKQRGVWYETLTHLDNAHWTVSMVGATHIDKQGIMSAVRTALARALEHLALDPQHCRVLLDGGLHAPDTYADQTTIVRGDATEPTIAAGAILAKVTRDRYMIEQDTKFPEYRFAKHKGYGTKLHREALRTHGLCPLHRKTFIHL